MQIQEKKYTKQFKILAELVMEKVQYFLYFHINHDPSLRKENTTNFMDKSWLQKPNWQLLNHY